MKNYDCENLCQRYTELKQKTSIGAFPVTMGGGGIPQSFNLNDPKELDEIKIKLTELSNECWDSLSTNDWMDILGTEGFTKKTREISENQNLKK